MKEYLRICIDRIEGDRLYGHDGSAEELRVALYTAGRGDHRYLAGMVRQGSQANIIDYDIVDGTYRPRLIVLEPDYLVDVSAIANCCEPYGNTHLTHLVNRLKPTAHTEAILLGHFASQLLDEEAHGQHRPYRESVMDFFRHYTLPLLAADLSDTFHDNVRQQRDNIHRTFCDSLPRESTDAILEPSFISEMYGLQGRIDYLQADHSLLIEQKSGRCGWPQPHPAVPVEQAKHAMQMMLYGAVVEQLHPEGEPPRTCLLYSKYPQPLLPLSPNKELLCEAIRLRNHIVDAEYRYAHEGYGILTSLTADDLNLRGTASTLWTRWQQPQIAQTLAPIAAADDMERAYYLRMMRFVGMEHLYAKVGQHGTAEHGYAAKWHDSLEEKLSKGDICHRLRLVSPTHGHEGKVESLTLATGEGTDLQATNFRKGDIVVLYPYGEAEPDVRKRIVYRCVLSELTLRTLTLTLRAPQTDARVLLRHAEGLWAIEHDLMEASYGSCYRALHAFLSMPRDRRDLLLLRREPRTDTTLRLEGHYGAFDPLVLRAKQARELFLLIGPPGTGKTSYGLMSILHEELASASSPAILLLAYTNRAVDEICSRLIEARLGFIRIGSPHTCPEAYHPYLLDTAVAGSTSLHDVRSHIQQARIVVGTAMTLNAHSELFALKRFSLAIVDEASQLLEPHIIGILSAMHQGRSAVERFVLIGDHKQLPAVVRQSAEESQVLDPLLHGAMLTNCRESLFERMIKRYGSDERAAYMLHSQGRMHRDIARFPNQAFYKGTLTEATPEQHAPLPAGEAGGGSLQALFACRTTFLDVPTETLPPADKTNPTEATLIAAIAATAYEQHRNTFDPLRTLGIIVPYRNQIAAVRSQIERYGIGPLNGITIDTVERYQGSQRDIIIYGFTVHHPTQLEFLTEQTFVEEDAVIDRKLNVVMTRARHHLLMTGNARLLRTNPLFARLIDFIRANGLYMEGMKEQP